MITHIYSLIWIAPSSGSHKSSIPIDPTAATYPSFLTLKTHGSFSLFNINVSFLDAQLTNAFTYVLAKFAFAESILAETGFSSKCVLYT